jgi:hypothetical protein
LVSSSGGRWLAGGCDASVLVRADTVVLVLVLERRSEISRLESTAGERLGLLEGEVGELCADRYRLLDDVRDRTEGSERDAIALVVLSRAKAAKVNKPVRFCFEDTAESED